MENEGNDTTQNERYQEIPEDKRNILLQFMEITAKEEHDECLEILTKYNWQLEPAVQSTFNENIAPPDDYENIQRVPLQNDIRHQYTAGQNVVDVRRQNRWLSWLAYISYLPVNVLQAGGLFTYHCVTEFVLFVVRIIWPSFGRAPTDPLDDVMKFKEEYENLYGVVHPTFYLGSYAQVLSDARKELRFLLVYLHSGDHEDTPNFCREVLGNAGFVEYINGTMLFWGCDVKTNEGNRVSRAMRETSYPFLAIVCLRENRMTIVWKIQGVMNVDQLIAVCAQVINDNEASLIAARAERQERTVAQELRNEQDVAYFESLERDRQKEAERQRLIEEAKKEEEMKLKKQNDRIRKLENLETRRKEAKALFESLTEPSSKDDSALQIRIKMPSGQPLQRYFKKSDKLQLLYDFVLSHEDSTENFLLSTNYPRKTFPLLNNENMSLEELGIKSNIAIFVQNMDEDSSDDE